MNGARSVSAALRYLPSTLHFIFVLSFLHMHRTLLHYPLLMLLLLAIARLIIPLAIHICFLCRQYRDSDIEERGLFRSGQALLVDLCLYVYQAL